VAPSELELRRLAIAEALRQAGDEPADDADSDERVSIPPVEPAGEMSDTVSQALFGR
jgi:hypothetical protein